MQKAKDVGIPIFCYDNGVNSDIPVTTLATNDIEATHTLAEKIGESCGGFFEALGIESPGLSSAPAIGAYLARAAAEKLGLSKSDIEKAFYLNAKNLIDGARKSIYGE